MGITITGSYEANAAFLQRMGDESIHYEYPVNSEGKELDWKPGSALHAKTLPKLMMRGQASRTAMSSRYPTWRKIDRNVSCFIYMDEAELKVKAEDPTKPSRLVMPVSYAIRETLLTYIDESLLGGDFYFNYDGQGPEDTVGALLLQHIIQQQAVRANMELALRTHWQDSLTYGIGIAAPKWCKVYGQRSRWKVDGHQNFWGKFIETGASQYTATELLWEGNEIDNIDPYLYLPDPCVSVHKVQQGEFVGWMALENRMDLTSREQAGSEGLINCQYLKHSSGSSVLQNTEHGRGDRTGMDIYGSVNENRGVKNSVWVMYMYIKLIPKEWDLGESEVPEKWMFAVANDTIIIRAQPLGLDHNMFPVAVCSPDFDGYSISPVSKLELIYPIQEYIDWLYSTHNLNQRKTVNNTFIADPYMINIPTLKKAMSSPGGIVLTRRASWGKGVKDGLMQLATSDVTRSNIPDASHMTQMVEQILGATANQQGAFDNAPERRTAAEYTGTSGKAQSRSARMVRNIHAMSMRPLAMMMASHCIQLMSNDTYIKATGDWEKVLTEEYGLTAEKGRVKVSPRDLDINYDILSHDGKLPNSGDAAAISQLYQMAINHPLLSRRYDIVRMYSSLARRMGEKNISNFVIKTEVLPDDQVEKMYNAGMLSEMMGGSRGKAG